MRSSALHAAVMITALVCLTVLGVAGTISGHELAVIFTGIAGVVFGGGLATNAANGAQAQLMQAVSEGTVGPGVSSPPPRASKARH